MPNRVMTWSMPHTEMRSEEYRLEVEGTDVPVWLARVREAINRPEGVGWTAMLNGPTEWASFARFDADFPVEVRIPVARAFESAQVLPRSAGVAVGIERTEAGGRGAAVVRLTLERPGHLTLLLDDCDAHPLHLFARECERDAPDRNDPSVIYFGPGEHWVDTIRPQSGQTVYLHGDALVRAVLPAGAAGKRGGVLNLYSYPPPVIDLEDVEGVTVRGRGILDGTLLPHPARNLLRAHRCRNLRVEGVTLRNSPNWHFPIVDCDDVTVEGVAGISGRLNSDGINAVSSRRVTVRDCFIRGHDDTYAVKATLPGRVAEDILYERCVAWNDWGYALGITYETRADISRITYRDCDVVFARNWAIGVHVVDSGTISDVRFERIGVEYPRTSIEPHMGRQLVKMDVTSDVWGKDDRRGHVRGVVLRDVAVLSAPNQDVPRIVLSGCDAEHGLEDIRFENVRIGEQPLASPDDPRIRRNEFVRDLVVQG